MAQATASDTHSFLRGAEKHLVDHRQLNIDRIALGSCEDFAVMAGSTATCAGAPDCTIIEGTLGVFPGTSITGNFDANILPMDDANAVCAMDGLAAWKTGRAMSGTSTMLAEMRNLTFTAGVHVHESAINIALSTGSSTKIYLDAKGVRNAQFVFNIGTTLTTSANSEVVLLNGARADNVFWVLGTALTMGADSILVGNVLAGSSITMGTKAKIFGRAIAQAAVTCETACIVDSSVMPTVSLQPSSQPSLQPSVSLQPSSQPSVSAVTAVPTLFSNCVGSSACTGADINMVGNGGCVGNLACYKAANTSVGNGGCFGHHACKSAASIIVGDESCIGPFACSSKSANTLVGNKSCVGIRACYRAYSDIGTNSCKCDGCCEGCRGIVPADKCNTEDSDEDNFDADGKCQYCTDGPP